ncbi:MAG: glycine--tRNA ligase subunit alpha [Candidatus Dojkabacteria bacterium]|nr:glycine--tRNA ligase subunit alpha [Candidatus Dojkabacteria bacterium]
MAKLSLSSHKQAKPLTFQQMLRKLEEYWEKQGCVIGQPYGLEVGAGTANPHTYFRVLGPEPWKVAYVEPSRRPADSRYGQNPNRMQHYFQFQVILKPAPADNIQLYLNSLEAIGIDAKAHDVRFLEDNWEAPSIGAWGTGWEVWLDGMEITQYTYFQQIGGVNLDPVPIEITYGPERIAMYLQNVDDFKKIKWDDNVLYGDMFERQEHWQSVFNIETADIDRHQKLFELYHQEAQAQIEEGNHRAAYDNVLKMSHIFNILDTRGAVGVSERAHTFRQMQHLSSSIAKLYLEERKELNYPLMKKS